MSGCEHYNTRSATTRDWRRNLIRKATRRQTPYAIQQTNEPIMNVSELIETAAIEPAAIETTAAIETGPSGSKNSNTRRRYITSCTTCRRRKVRCDRGRPHCARCEAGGYSCAYAKQGAEGQQQVGRQQAGPVPASSRSPSASTSAFASSAASGAGGATRRRGREATDEGSEERGGGEGAERAAGRPAGRGRQVLGADLLERLRRLEDLVQRGLRDDAGGAGGGRGGSEEGPGTAAAGVTTTTTTKSTTATKDGGCGKSPKKQGDKKKPYDKFAITESVPVAAGVCPMPGKFMSGGTMLTQDGRTRYVSPMYWGVLTEEIQSLSSLILSDDGQNITPPYSSPSTESRSTSDMAHDVNSMLGQDSWKPSSAAYIFPDNELKQSPPLTFMPIYQSAARLFYFFKERADPVIRILHIPTLENDFDDYFAQRSVDKRSPAPYRAFSLMQLASKENSNASFEALLYAVFFAASKTFADDEILTDECLNHPFYGLIRNQSDPRKAQADLLAKFKNSAELALSRARFIEGGDVLSILALTMILIASVNEANPPPGLYPLSGLLLRMAQSQGLHRDPAVLFRSKGSSVQQICEVECEIRRRLWHHICLLDIRACEAYGPEPGVGLLEEDMWPRGKGTRFPRCVDDEELSPTRHDTTIPREAEEGPPQRFTSMNMQLAKFHATLCLRKMAVISAKWPGNFEKPQSKEALCQKWQEFADEMRAEVERVIEYNEKQYFGHCAINDPEDETTMLSGGLSLRLLKSLMLKVCGIFHNKLWIMFYHRFYRNKSHLDGAKVSESHREYWQQEDFKLRKKILYKCLENLKARQDLIMDPMILPFKWNVMAHSQLHAAVHILWELKSVGPDKVLSECARRTHAETWRILGELDYTIAASTPRNESIVLNWLKERVGSREGPVDVHPSGEEQKRNAAAAAEAAASAAGGCGSGCGAGGPCSLGGVVDMGGKSFLGYSSNSMQPHVGPSVHQNQNQSNINMVTSGNQGSDGLATPLSVQKQQQQQQQQQHPLKGDNSMIGGGGGGGFGNPDGCVGLPANEVVMADFANGGWEWGLPQQLGELDPGYNFGERAEWEEMTRVLGFDYDEQYL
ncbi:hypothetical protein DFH27DRAFT_640017 [Peziza echinospora]|nr:hypothetical protein DFH27DRAFT_640017 [Peziza echinospora]